MSAGFAWESNSAGGFKGTTSLVAVLGRWDYILVRTISATNRRIAVLSSEGVAAHAQSTNSVTLTGHNSLSLGAWSVAGFITTSGGMTGTIAEMFYSATDIQPDGTQLSDATLRQIAYGSPFSMASIAKDIAEYRALFSTAGGGTFAQGEILQRRPATWSNTLIAPGPHPPLFPSYKRPSTAVRNVLG
jgi:hypothetical protein